MNSRQQILDAIKRNQPEFSHLAEIKISPIQYSDLKEKFVGLVTSIGGTVCQVNSWSEISEAIKSKYPSTKRIVNTIQALPITATNDFVNKPHQFENVELAILQGKFGVAENGAVWITDDCMGDRVLPFISQHLALVINSADIVHTLHEAYARIGSSSYNLGTFIAGPSKTADIEQSLVLGAHGAKSLTVFIINNPA